MTTTSDLRWTATGGVIDETRATLTLQGADLDPEELTRLMGVTPTRSHRRGDLIGAGREETRPSGDWVLEVNVRAPEETDAVLSKLFAMLPESDAAWAELNSRYQVSLHLMMVAKAWNRGFQLSTPLLQEVARRGLALTFEVYAEPQQLPSACFT
ncbi:MAG: DUF4279 domain-containing protein [Dehalococcoidia bacterium]